jgi:hypothetical protein
LPISPHATERKSGGRNEGRVKDKDRGGRGIKGRGKFKSEGEWRRLKHHNITVDVIVK